MPVCPERDRIARAAGEIVAVVEASGAAVLRLDETVAGLCAQPFGQRRADFQFDALGAGMKAVKASKSLMSDKSVMLKAGGLIRLMPSAGEALAGIGGTFGTGLAYLSFSGVNTKTAQSQLVGSLGPL